jgi:hypothetical protein
LNNQRINNSIHYEDLYDFFPVAIATIKNIIVEKLTCHTQRPKQEGGFFKFTCTLLIDLEKSMIFNEIEKRTAKIICNDNCVVYACKHAGVDDKTINDLKRIIKTRQLPQTKLKILAEECEIEFQIMLENTNVKVYKPKYEPRYSIKLYLIENHYLLKESFPVSLYFIKNYEAIMNDQHIKNWPLEDKMRIYRLRNNRYEK